MDKVIKTIDRVGYPRLCSTLSPTFNKELNTMNKSIKQIREELLTSGDEHLVNVAEELDDSQLLLLTVLVNNERQIELLDAEE